jgi:hypothetical protein
MASSSDEPDSNRKVERSAGQGSHVRRSQLEAARKLALEAIEADHQALELGLRLSHG